MRRYLPLCLAALATLQSACGGGSVAGPPPPPPPPAITVSVSPSAATMLTGESQQFTATVTGSTNTTVNWSVNGVAGGNASVGTITAAGLYSAPSTAPSGAVTIRATSAASSTSGGDLYGRMPEMALSGPDDSSSRAAGSPPPPSTSLALPWPAGSASPTPTCPPSSPISPTSPSKPSASCRTEPLPNRPSLIGTAALQSYCFPRCKVLR